MEGDWEGVESERELKANEDMIESMFQREKRKMWERPVDEIVDIIEGKGIKTKLGEKSGKKKNKKKRQDETKNVRAVLELEGAEGTGKRLKPNIPATEIEQLRTLLKEIFTSISTLANS
eukprot:TRINITY_DN10738_c0_g1_i2.p5 TRINITY_DN10738_c0_g1~~TRINITY_DN10738_c0_g1_i2.p5  ORF type:complete len:119 (-),score=38.46 TRINITY_DN10738_c0_g1_i2:137-493(-)